MSEERRERATNTALASRDSCLRDVAEECREQQQTHHTDECCYGNNFGKPSRSTARSVLDNRVLGRCAAHHRGHVIAPDGDCAAFAVRVGLAAHWLRGNECACSGWRNASVNVVCVVLCCV